MVPYQVITDPEEHHQFTVPVQHRIIQCTKRRTHISQSRYLAIEHIEQTGKQDQSAGPAHIRKIAAVALFCPGNKMTATPTFNTKPIVVTALGVSPILMNSLTKGSITYRSLSAILF
jgi:hypothetical protein